MRDEHRDLAAAEAVGALGPEDAAELWAEIERDPALASELDEYRTTVAVLETSVAREVPRYDLFAGILAQIEPQSPPAPSESVERRRTWGWRRTLPAFAVGAAATAVVFALAFALGSDETLGTPDAVASVRGAPEFAGVHGDASLYDTESADGRLRLELADVPPAQPGEHYEVWVLRPSAGGAMEAVGVFNPVGSDVELELGLPGSGDYVAVDISVEPDAGSPDHSGTSLAGGKFE